MAQDEDEDKPHFLDRGDVRSLGTEEQKAAYAQLETHLEAARAALQEAQRLADQHKLSFYFGINTYNPSYDPYDGGVNTETGWQHSAVC
jgi:hypothetical protein